MDSKAPDREWQHFAPVGGWVAFRSSPALTAAIWQQFPASDWHCLSLTAGSSVWESRQDTSMVVVHYEGDSLVELVVQVGAANEAVRPLFADFRLIPVDGVTF